MNKSFFLVKSITAIECICIVLYSGKFSFVLIRLLFSKLNHGVFVKLPVLQIY